jgi:hypothetical protein
MAWRLAESLKTLRNQINAQYPNRSKVSDGTIGDAKHSSRRSDHNPNARGVVCAFDITEDHKNGPDLVKLLPLLLKDKRTHYVIYERKIYNTKIKNGAARPYSGANAHSHHLHLSVFQDAKLYDDPTPWNLGDSKPMPLEAPKTPAEAPKPALMSDTAKAVSAPPGPTVAREQTKYDPQRAVSFFMGRGWSKNAAIALVANIMWESGGNSKWTIVWDAKGDKDKQGVYRSRYCAQWNGPRIEAYEKFAKEIKRDVLDPYAQLAFVEYELKTTERRAGTLLKNATSLEEAVAAAITFWRPSIPHADKRLAIARKLNDQSR